MVNNVQVSKFLAKLGTTAEQVAESLRKLGIKGRRVSACNCPIARAVKKQFPSAQKFSISQHSFSLSGKRVRGVSPVTPDGARDFISKFDSSLYTYTDLAETE